MTKNVNDFIDNETQRQLFLKKRNIESNDALFVCEFFFFYFAINNLFQKLINDSFLHAIINEKILYYKLFKN